MQVVTHSRFEVYMTTQETYRKPGCQRKMPKCPSQLKHVVIIYLHTGQRDVDVVVVEHVNLWPNIWLAHRFESRPIVLSRLVPD
jgi:hypothetical protein